MQYLILIFAFLATLLEKLLDFPQNKTAKTIWLMLCAIGFIFGIAQMFNQNKELEIEKAVLKEKFKNDSINFTGIIKRQDFQQKYQLDSFAKILEKEYTLLASAEKLNNKTLEIQNNLQQQMNENTKAKYPLPSILYADYQVIVNEKDNFEDFVKNNKLYSSPFVHNNPCRLIDSLSKLAFFNDGHGYVKFDNLNVLTTSRMPLLELKVERKGFQKMRFSCKSVSYLAYFPGVDEKNKIITSNKMGYEIETEIGDKILYDDKVKRKLNEPFMSLRYNFCSKNFTWTFHQIPLEIKQGSFSSLLDLEGSDISIYIPYILDKWINPKLNYFKIYTTNGRSILLKPIKVKDRHDLFYQRISLKEILL